MTAHPGPQDLTFDHTERMQRALLSLEGLSIGDAFGQCFFYQDKELIEGRLTGRHAPPPPWFFTDDTIMAMSIVRTLAEYGGIDQDVLAKAFASDYVKDPSRGYGGTAHSILRQISDGTPWKVASQQAFDGMGSMGNGGAMRATPIGAYFADDISKVVHQASLSAEVTHAHSEGQAGAIAVAAAAAWAFNNRSTEKFRKNELIEYAADYTPDGETRRGLYKALRLPPECSIQMAAMTLGNGSQVISSDTVPFTLWCAARHLDDYAEALWTTVAGYGDRDTTCAIVGGIVALSATAATLPTEWKTSREPLQLH